MRDGPHLPDEGDPVDAGHVAVDQDEVEGPRPRLDHGGDRVAVIGDGHVGLGLQEEAQPHPHGGAVVDEERVHQRLPGRRARPDGPEPGRRRPSRGGRRAKYVDTGTIAATPRKTVEQH